MTVLIADAPRKSIGLRKLSALRVLVIDGHPRPDSLGSSLAEIAHRATGSRTSEGRYLCLRDLQFDPCHRGGLVEPAIRQAQRDLLWAQVVVFVYPTWWGTMPALLKGFLDRVLEPGFAFAERSDGGWKGLLDGRAALLVTTMDTPRWIYRWLLGAPGHRAMRDATLGFCGIAPVKILEFGPVRTSTLAQRRQWLAQVARAGRGLESSFFTGTGARARAWRAAARLHFYVQPWLGYTTGAVVAVKLAGAEWHWPAYLLGYLAIALVEFITVLTNEIEDLPSDRLNANASALTGGSRVLVKDILTPADLSWGRNWALGALLAVVLAGLAFIPSFAPLLGLGGIALVLGLAYSTPPLRLSARGLGELDVAVTHSILVVLAGVASQGVSLWVPAAWAIALPLSLAVFPSIILAAFPDFEADSATGKRTLAVRSGRPSAARLAGAFAIGAAFLPIFLWKIFPLGAWTSLFAIPHALWLLVFLRRYLRSGAPAGRIDGLLVIALTFMLWHAIVPLLAISLAR